MSKPAAIVFDLEFCLMLMQPQRDFKFAGSGVLHNICDRFLADAQQLAPNFRA